MLLDIKKLNLKFESKKGLIHALRDIDLSLSHGETLGIVGESGCGKSLTNFALMGLLPLNARLSYESFQIHQQRIEKTNEKIWQTLRGKKIGMIFQNPMSALNPVLTIGYQLDEILQIHRRDLKTKKQRRNHSIELLEKVGIPSPERRLTQYPFELSGGMAQRVMIATALAPKPEILIADEPTTALDVTIQAQVLKLLKDLQKENQMGMIFVTHDLAVVSQVADRIQVMYAGEVIENATVSQLIHLPRHPYTSALIKSRPPENQEHPKSELPTISGIVPSLANRAKGCQFAPRCPYRTEECVNGDIKLHQDGDEFFRCLHPVTNPETQGGLS